MGKDIFGIMNILSANAEKPFVKRVINPEKFPKLDNKDGTVSTHSMAWGEDAEGNAFVYPTVVMGSDGNLVRIPEDQAMDRAMQSGNIIKMKDAAEADWFSKNYKQIWDIQ